MIYLEDYLILLAQKKNIGKIKVASYDGSPIDSMAQAAIKADHDSKKECLTDRQIVLAKKIVEKYRKQFMANGILLPETVDDIPVKFDVRSIDRAKTLTLDIEQKKLYLKFPYDPQLIVQMQSLSTASATSVEWDNSKKCWSVDFTEENIAKILDIFNNKDLQICKNLEPIIVEFFKIDKFLPTFSLVDNKMKFVNCHESVLRYAIDHGWTADDLGRLPYWTAVAASMALEIDDSIFSVVEQMHGKVIANWIQENCIWVSSKNLPDGKWLDQLKTLNHILTDAVWILDLTWWTPRTNWSEFKNITPLKNVMWDENAKHKHYIVISDKATRGKYSLASRPTLKTIYINI